MSRNSIFLGVALTALLSIFVVLLIVPAMSTREVTLPFLAASKDKNVILFFGFTSCPMVCPVTLSNLSAAYEKLPPAQRERYEVVFVDVLPRTPTSDEQYAQRFNKAFKTYVFSADEIDHLKNTFGVFLNVTDNKISHSTYLYRLQEAASGKWQIKYTFRSNSEVASDDSITSVFSTNL
jgi:cytochrome oxidase Cu insertion factor (SCO1/SenC/PrrC family)